MRSGLVVVVFTLLLVLAYAEAPLQGVASGGGLGGSGAPQAFVDPEVFSYNSSFVDVLIVARPASLDRVNGLGRAAVISMLKEWSSRELSDIIGYLRSINATIHRTFWIVPAVSATIPKGSVEKLASLPGVREIILNTRKFHVEGSVKPGGLDNGGVVVNWGVPALNVTKAWSLGFYGGGVRIAILDTGVDVDHPALSGKLLTLDPGDPTYPGGWIEFDSDGVPLCSLPRDTHGHGTFVASIALGGDLNNTIVGVAPLARLMAALVLPGGSGTPAQVLAGFEWAADPYTCHGNSTGLPPHIVSFSAGWKGYTGDFLLDAIKALLTLGVVVVASIGNNGYGATSYPGNVWGVIGVGAVNESLDVASFSGGGVVLWSEPPKDWPFKPPYPSEYVKPDFTAPGVNVGGAVPGGGYGYGNGTSFAAPHIAGVAALVLQALGALDFRSPVKDYTLPELVYDVLVNASLDLEDPGKDGRYGWGVPNALAAVELAVDLVSYTPLNVTLNATTARVGDPVKVLVKPEPGGGEPPDGTPILVYLDNETVASANYTKGGVNVTLRVPPLTKGQHTVEVTSLDGEFRGNATLTVIPSLSVEPAAAEPGSTVVVKAHGHEANTVYEVLLDGMPRARLITGPEGSGVTTLGIPPGTSHGAHYVFTVKENTTEVEANATVNVVEVGELRVAVAAAGEYFGHSIVYILTSLNGEPVNASVQAFTLAPNGSLQEVPVSKLVTGIYVAQLNLSQEYTLLYVNASLEAQGVRARGAAIALIYNNSITPSIKRSLDSGIAALKTLLEANANKTSEIAEYLESMNDTLTLMISMISTINSRIESLEVAIDQVQDAVNSSAESLESKLTLLQYSMNTSASTIISSVNESTASLQAGLSSLNKTIAEKAGHVEAEIAKVKGDILERIDALEKTILLGLNNITSSIEVKAKEIASLINARYGELLNGIESIYTIAAKINSSIASLSKSLEEVKESVNGILAKLDYIKSALARVEDKVNTGFNGLMQALESLAREVQSSNVETQGATSSQETQETGTSINTGASSVSSISISTGASNSSAGHSSPSLGASKGGQAGGLRSNAAAAVLLAVGVAVALALVKRLR